MDYLDGITIGTLITEQKLGNGIISSDAINKLYDMKYRSDLTPASPKVRNDGIGDTSHVYEVVQKLNQSIVEKLTDEIDVNVTNDFIKNDRIATIDFEHQEIHEGHHYFITKALTLTSGQTQRFVTTVGNLPLHTVLTVWSDVAGFNMRTLEGIAANLDGTVVTPINNNRTSSQVSTGRFELNPTGVDTTGALVMRDYPIGVGGTPSSRVGGSAVRDNEVILKPNTKYLLEISNLSTSSNTVIFNQTWYSHEV